ncbi:unnamed protein product, partial [Durusdinium trenchii]
CTLHLRPRLETVLAQPVSRRSSRSTQQPGEGVPPRVPPPTAAPIDPSFPLRPSNGAPVFAPMKAPVKGGTDP